MNLLYCSPLSGSGGLNVDLNSSYLSKTFQPLQPVLPYNPYCYGLPGIAPNQTPGFSLGQQPLVGQGIVLGPTSRSDGVTSTYLPKYAGVPFFTSPQRKFGLQQSSSYTDYQMRLNRKVKCDICNITLNSMLQAKQHNSGKFHQRKIRQLERKTAKMCNASSGKEVVPGDADTSSTMSEDGNKSSRENLEDSEESEAVESSSAPDMDRVSLDDTDAYANDIRVDGKKGKRRRRRSSPGESEVEPKRPKLILEGSSQSGPEKLNGDNELHVLDQYSSDSMPSAIIPDIYSTDCVTMKAAQKSEVSHSSGDWPKDLDCSPEISSSVQLTEDTVTELSSGECGNIKIERCFTPVITASSETVSSMLGDSIACSRDEDSDSARALDTICDNEKNSIYKTLENDGINSNDIYELPKSFGPWLKMSEAAPSRATLTGDIYRPNCYHLRQQPLNISQHTFMAPHFPLMPGIRPYLLRQLGPAQYSINAPHVANYNSLPLTESVVPPVMNDSSATYIRHNDGSIGLRSPDTFHRRVAADQVQLNQHCDQSIPYIYGSQLCCIGAPTGIAPTSVPNVHTNYPTPQQSPALQAYQFISPILAYNQLASIHNDSNSTFK